jgi:phosphatidylglycerophosphatase C
MSGSGHDDRVVVAAFDVDGTLTTRDCVVPFLARFAAHPRVLVRALRRLPHLLAAIVHRDRDRLKAVVSEVVLQGVELERLEAEAAEFAEVVVHTRLRPDTTARLRWHGEQGHRLLLVSASYAVYLRHVAEALGVDVVIATELEAAGGVCTGRLMGPNCRAAEKQRRLASWLAAEGFERDRVTVWAYGDSAGDRELLAAADHPVWVTTPLGSVAPSH